MNSTMRIQVLASIAFFASTATWGFVPEHSATYYEAIKPEVREAQRHGAKACLVFTVVDDEGNPVSNAAVNATWQNDYPRRKWKSCYVTDVAGKFVASDTVGHSFACTVRKEWFYFSCDYVKFDWRPGVSPLVKDGKWQPYGEHRTIVIKRKKNPVAITWYNWGIDGCSAPATNVWIGLDLETGQWCKPYGAGKHEDAAVRFSGSITDRFTWDTKTEISFANIPYAGFYTLAKDEYSDMKSCYSASTNATSYSDRILTFTSSSATRDQTASRLAGDRYIVFRTRCTVDEDGNLLSAHYGKICGEFWGGKMNLMFRGNDNGVYFNPTPNDPNLEDRETINRLQLLGR